MREQGTGAGGLLGAGGDQAGGDQAGWSRPGRDQAGWSRAGGDQAGGDQAGGDQVGGDREVGVSRRLVNLTLDNLDDLPRRCRRCVFWELDPIAGEAAEESGDPGLEKEAWVSATLLDWGSCGKIAYVDSLLAGFVLYAPPVHVPRSLAFPTSPVSGDAVLLMTARVQPEFQGGGLGRMLVQGAAKDLSRRGIKAIEAFGDARKEGIGPEHPARPGADSADRGSCLVPADYLLAVGFKTVRPHHRFPRLRLELKNALSWREDVEVALERLLGSMNPEPVFRPV
jgi:GNAT superfamily N-acetyltransferase